MKIEDAVVKAHRLLMLEKKKRVRAHRAHLRMKAAQNKANKKARLAAIEKEKQLKHEATLGSAGPTLVMLHKVLTYKPPMKEEKKDV